MKVRILVSGIARDIESKGKKHTFSECWVSLPGLPYPVRWIITVLILAPRAIMTYPCCFKVRDRRILFSFNFRQAVPVKVLTMFLCAELLRRVLASSGLSIPVFSCCPKGLA